jgi:hypothetical protein
MDNLNRHLGDQMLSESIKGGAAHFRPAHQAANPQAQHLAELKQEKAEKKHRVLCLRLPGMAPRYLRLPQWALVGRLSA